MKQKTIIKIIKELNKLYPVRYWREKPFKVLITTILSQRTRDEVTGKSSGQLYNIADTPEKILKLSEKKIAELIYPVGFYKQKSKKIKKVCRILIEKYDGKVPESREELMELPGVGGKTADCVLCFAYNKPEIPVDVHVAVVSRRLGLTRNKDPEKIKGDLYKQIPEKQRRIINHLFVEFGKEICNTRKPKCYKCPVRKYCKFYHSSS